ncbi:hypothetical protein [Nonomuraea jabiensis]|uniref:Dihydrofolate reductase n=1 Tax=Nonomuraea jabiensis TaxID=882448 RepID=A0A7W9L9K8_9ACTN|nr:hypothetical protein [Nonomuraea jabiensis]MBB5775720.1 hypothetical protein [Nonomuraea jabiensis]
MSSAGGSLYGRRLYENTSAYWPTADERPDDPVLETRAFPSGIVYLRYEVT